MQYRIITDRGVTHELVRHRLFSFAQESTRYCNYSGGIEFYCTFYGLVKMTLLTVVGMS